MAKSEECEDKDKMEELSDYTLKQVSDFLIDKISKEKKISKSLARKLLINALTYKVVILAIDEQIDFLMGTDDEMDEE